MTKRRERDERLREVEAKYRTLVEQVPFATYVSDLGLPVRRRHMGPQIESLLGFPASSWLEPGFLTSRLHPEDRERVVAEIEETQTTGQEFRGEYRLLDSEGEVVWVLDETVAVRDEEYRPLFLQGFLVDITDRRRADDDATPASLSALLPAAR